MVVMEVLGGCKTPPTEMDETMIMAIIQADPNCQ